MDFIAIDFETACGNANSACQLGLVQVIESKIVREECWLIRPPRMYFAPRNIAIHGIRPHQVGDAPTMEQLWSELSPFIDGQVLIAHNARFDIGVLVASLAAHDVACPSLEFSCTRTLARAAWPGRARYGLKFLAESLGIRFQHHDALEDARCCAKIALAAAESCGHSSLEQFETEFRIRRGFFNQGRIVGPRAIGRRRQTQPAEPRQTTDKWGFPDVRATRVGAVNPAEIAAAATGNPPLAGKNIVMLGALRGLSESATRQLIRDLGGNCQTQISASTDFVVACGTTLAAASQQVCESLAKYDNSREADPPESETETNGSTPSNTNGIRLLSERQFRALIPGGKASAW